MQSAALPIQAIYQASRDLDLLAAVAELYELLADRITERAPTCWNRGLCCHFEQYGHRLFVTPMELAYFLQSDPTAEGGRSIHSAPSSQEDRELPSPRHAITILDPATTPGACPYKTQNSCGVRSIRPLGCRIFYCQTGTEAWQQELMEQFLNDLRGLHTEWKVPYAYVEWLEALRQLWADADHEVMNHSSERLLPHLPPAPQAVSLISLPLFAVPKP